MGIAWSPSWALSMFQPEVRRIAEKAGRGALPTMGAEVENRNLSLACRMRRSRAGCWHRFKRGITAYAFRNLLLLAMPVNPAW